MNNDKQQNQGLQKSLNPMSVWAIAFGCIIGWGSFINPGKKFLPNSGVAGTAIAMVLGALVMVIIAFSSEDSIRELFRAEPYDLFLAKPYTLAELKAALAAAEGKA